MTRQKLIRGLGFTAVGILFGAVLWLLRRELHGVRYHDILAAIGAIPGQQVALAIVLTICGYLALSLYDFFGLRYAGRPLPYRATAPASFIAYALSNNIGLSVFGSMAFRYRPYTTLGLSPFEIAKVAAFCSMTFWLGLLALGGVVLTVTPSQHAWLGPVMLCLAVLYVGLCAVIGGKEINVRGYAVAVPKMRLAFTQIGISALDWLGASAVLYVLMPTWMNVTYPHFLSIYLFATVMGLVSHVPGGLGVVEVIFVAALRDKAPVDAVLGSLLAFRAIYYFAPLAAAAVLFAALEMGRRPRALGRLTSLARVWVPTIIPRFVSVATFVAGALLLFSGVTPDVASRRHLLAQVLPLPLVESFHLFAGLTGAALLLIGRGLQKRLDGAYVVAVALLALGIVASLAKGLDYEEAVILGLTLAALLPCRRYFYRKASLLEARFSAGWITAIAAVLGSMVWLMLFAYKHVEYSQDLWWTFAFHEDAPRSLRVAFVAISTALIVGFAFLMRPLKARVRPNLEAVGPLAQSIIERSDKTYANLALLGDKAIMVNDAANALLMFGTEGRSWIAMGDPIGPESARRELIWRFRDLCDRHGSLPAFYQVDAENLQYYVEAGLSLVKIGEEAVVDLAGFSLEGKTNKGLRNIVNRLEKEGLVFEVVAREHVDALMPELARISRSWLGHKRVREKGFSLGFYSEDYLRRFPIAVVRKGERAVAFANLWETASKTELSVDLMRFSDEAPGGSMDYLFAQLMLWGKAQGYATFNLGMAPFSGMENRPLAPLWSRLGATIYNYGEHFYNFQGLREYKEKFHPVWRAKFLASPPGRSVPIVLANIASLVSGGLKGVVAR